MRFLSFSGILFLAATCTLLAQDKVFPKGAANPVEGVIKKVDDAAVYLTITGVGDTTFQRTAIDRVEITKPSNLEGGQKAASQQNHAEAIQTLEPIYLKYRGLPQNWIEQATISLGGAYLQAKQWEKAKSLYASVKKFYPKTISIDLATSGEAQALLELKQPDKAILLLEPMATEGSKSPAVSEEKSLALGKAHLILGRCYAAAGKAELALESFLKTITLYYADIHAVAEAQYESALLFEKMNNIVRARGQLEEVKETLKKFPTLPLFLEAQKKLETLKTP